MSGSAIEKLQAIRVRTEASSGNIKPLLFEVRHALAQLLEHNTTHVIDLKAIPLAPGEPEAILEALGDGEVCAELESLGRSEIRETSYPGVWIVTHFDDAGDIKARFIEITRMPTILESQPSDIVEAVARLEATLGR